MMTILAFIVVFSVIVISHEYGHYIGSRIAGIKVLEMGLGFGPRIFMFVKNGIRYTLNLIPLGGFINIAGINPAAEEKDDRYLPAESYLNKTPAQKFLTIIGGPLGNLVIAFVLFLFIFSIFGVPSGISNEIAIVAPGSEAQRIGLAPGDRILEVKGRQVIKMEDSVKLIHKSAGQRIALKISRNGKTMELSADVKYDAKMKIGLIGFSLKPYYKRIGILSSISEAAKQVGALVVLFLYMLWLLVTGRAPVSDIAGPVGIAQFTGQAAGEGIISLLAFTAFLSINLGVINLLPIPALDGGRIVFILIEAVRKKAVDIELENRIHYVGIALLMLLTLVITMNDIMRLFGR